jgi:hypothetical protein
MKRLFVFGCSFSSYLWPSWADVLSREFDYYENWAIAGTGNRAIFLRLTEFLSKNKLTKDDVVVIQWSSHLRNDYYTQKWYTEFKQISWKTFGNIFGYLNEDIYDKKWVDTFFYEPAYFYETLNYIHAAQRMLEGTDARYFMTSMNKFNIDKLDELEEISPNNLENLNSYIDPVFNERSYIWIEPIRDYCNLEDDFWAVLVDIKKFKFEKDLHPTTRAQVRWLENNLIPKLNLENYTTPDDFLDSIDSTFIEASKDRYKFNELLIDKGLFTAHVYRGF